MSLRTWWNGMPRPARTAILAVVVAPLAYWATRDVGEALALWLIVCSVSLVPSAIVRSVIAPVDGIGADDVRHPRHDAAFRLELIVTILVAALVVIAVRLIGIV